MARKRLATFSVKDHANPRDLVPAVLRFDKQAFPFPADQKEWDRWSEWDPKLLEHCLIVLSETAIPLDWGKSQRAAFQQLGQQDEALASLSLLTGGPIFTEPQTPDGRWEADKFRTRQVLADMLRYTWGSDYWISPAYTSRAAMQQARAATLASTGREARAENLALLIAHEMEVPDSADPIRALRLAAGLAGDSAFQKSRRALNNWEESLLTRAGTVADDAQEFADLIADLNGHTRRHSIGRRNAWLFTLMKTPVRVVEALHNPIGAINSVIETIEVASGQQEERPDGPLAVFFDVRERVIKPSQSRPGFWDIL